MADIDDKISRFKGGEKVSPQGKSGGCCGASGSLGEIVGKAPPEGEIQKASRGEPALAESQEPPREESVSADSKEPLCGEPALAESQEPSRGEQAFAGSKELLCGEPALTESQEPSRGESALGDIQEMSLGGAAEDGFLVELQESSDRGCGACPNGCHHKPECFDKNGNAGKPSILRWGCGCFIISLILILAFILFAGNAVVSAVGDLSSCAFDTAKGIAATVAERLKADPKATVYVDFKFTGAGGVDKLVCAEVRREIGKVVKFEDFKVFSALLEVRATAIFEYYVPLEKMRVGLSMAPDGKLDVSVFFPAPLLSVPVKFNISEYDVTKSFIPKLNAAANKYMSDDFPRMLEEYGNQEDVVSHARELARKRLEQTVRAAILPLIGISGNSGENVRIIFDSSELEKPAQITHEINVKSVSEN